MPFSSISTWLTLTSSTLWGSEASVEWSWYGAPHLSGGKKFLWLFRLGNRLRSCLVVLPFMFSLLWCLPTGAAQKRGEQNICHEDPEEAAHRGHQAAGAHPLREAHHAGGAL